MLGYVHRWELVGESWRGTGWTEPLELVLSRPATFPALPCDSRITDGAVDTGSLRYENLLPLPFVCTGDVVLHLQLGATEYAVPCDGLEIRAAQNGEPRFIEDLPESLRPDVPESI
ncbi:MAG: hypothetical protein HOW73_24120 [Polyangiaceae bacterium]|nr:hypothetical protein [Polyangiaceae bacterium]